MRSWLDIAGAVMRRDARLALSYRANFVLRVIGSLVPVVILFEISKLVGPARQLGPYAGNYFGFALVGLCAASFATFGQTSFSTALNDEQQQGTFEVLLASPTRLSAVVVGMFMMPLVMTAVVVLIFVAVGLALGVHLAAGGVVPASIILLELTATFVAFGIGSGAFLIVAKRGDPIGTVLVPITTLLAGAVFPVSVLPKWLADLAHAVPAYWGLRGARDALITDAGWSTVWPDMLILAGFVAGLMLLATWVLGRAMRYARVAGLLGAY